MRNKQIGGKLDYFLQLCPHRFYHMSRACRFDFFPLDGVHLVALARGPVSAALATYKQAAWKLTDDVVMESDESQRQHHRYVWDELPPMIQIRVNDLLSDEEREGWLRLYSQCP